MENYTPTNDDILNLRTITTAISETIINSDEKPIHVFDVSGLDYHRKKWIPYFDTVNSVIFVASLSAYDQLMIENDSINRMIDSLELFGSISNNPMLAKLQFILLLNKRDLYEQKITRSNIIDYFPEYTGLNY